MGQDLDTVFASLPGLYLILKPNAPHFTIEAVSDAFTAATLTKRADIIGKGIFEVFPDNPHDPDANGEAILSASLRKVLQTKKPDKLATQKYDITLPHGGYEERYWDSTNIPVLTNKGEVSYIINSADDVTEKVHMQAKQEHDKLEISQLLQRHNILFEQDFVAIAVLRGPNCIIEQANPLICNIWGRTKKQVIGKPLFSALPEVAGQGVEALFEAVFQTGKQYMGTEQALKLKRKGKKLETMYFNSMYIPIHDAKNVTTGIMVLCNDVTDQVKTRKKIQESERRFRFMTELLPQKIYTAGSDGRINYYNRQWVKYTGISTSTLLGVDRVNNIHPDDRLEEKRIWEKSATSGKPFEIKYRLRRFDGVYHWHLDRAHALRDASGEIALWIGSSTDIEDLLRNKELEKATKVLTEQRAKLLALNNSKDEFISLASHQLRTPATGVKQYVGMLLEGYAGELNESQRRFLKTAYDSNERQLTIVNDLLKVARVDSDKLKLKLEAVDIVPLIKEIIDEQRLKFSKNDQKITLVSTKPSVFAPIDKALLRMAIENIVDNAHKYTFPGKNVIVRLTETKTAVRITIKDQGTGIAESDLEKLFLKFSRIDNPLSATVGGSGLGLYWVKRVIDLHSGSITVKSELCKGTAFTIILKK